MKALVWQRQAGKRLGCVAVEGVQAGRPGELSEGDAYQGWGSLGLGATDR